MALGYVSDAARADKAKFKNFAAASRAPRQLFQGGGRSVGRLPARSPANGFPPGLVQRLGEGRSPETGAH